MGRAHSGARRTFSITMLVAAGFAITAFLILLLRLPDQFAGLKSGDLLPRVRLVSPDGQPVDTDSWRGRPTLLVFFDPSCPACQNELDNIDALAPALPGLRVALLSTRPQHSGETRIASYLDRTGVLTRRMRRFAVPAIYWISPDGRIQYARSGARSLTEDASIFNDLLARKGTTTADRKEGSAEGTGMLCR